MSIVTPGIVPASVLLAEPRPQWLDEWGAFAASLRFGDLSAELLAQAKLVMLDCVGAIAAGMQEPELRALAGRLESRGTGPVAAIGAGLTLRGDDAAWLNGIAGTTLELDEGNSFARGHPGIHVLPALLATAMSAGSSGEEALTAFVLGYEIGARVGAACRQRPTVHPHGTWGTIGAALAAARLEGADSGALAETVSVAATLAVSASLRAMLEGATVRNSYCGFSNRNGLAAWDLVASGFSGESDGVRSVFDGILAEGFRPEMMTDELGSRYEIQRNYFKRHAACRFTHGALDVMTGLIDEHCLTANDVERIEVETYAYAAQLDSATPHNMLAAKFSLPFAIATTIVNGAASVPAFRQGAVEDQTIRRLAARVTVRERADFTAMLPARRPSRLTVKLADGSVLTGETMTNRGDAADPYSSDEVVEKFFDLAVPVWGRAHAERIFGAIDMIETADTLDGLNALLAAPAHEETRP